MEYIEQLFNLKNKVVAITGAGGFLCSAMAKGFHSAGCAVAILDVNLDKDGIPHVTTHGWTKDSNNTLWDLLESYSETNLKHVLCTDIARDGALLGPNVSLYHECVDRYPHIDFQASGGVRDVNDLHVLKKTGVAYAISGKALLEQRFSNEEISLFLPNG